ncbi:MAG: hypothetical protein SFX18_04660 [Pirellulales bacterium]|nr:hypothetical protein [Pirellulales bacterium]
MNPPPTERRAIPWMNLFLIFFGIVVVLGTAIAIWPVDNSLTVSPQTTVITAPLAADGLPDYVAFVNQENSRGILPSENVYVDILRTYGLSDYYLDQYTELFQQLGTHLSADKNSLATLMAYDYKLLPSGADPNLKRNLCQ